jgi:hypothetical protein
MNKPYGRIAENVLFAVLLAAVIGWTAVPVSAGPLSASSGAGSLAATTAASHHS